MLARHVGGHRVATRSALARARRRALVASGIAAATSAIASGTRQSTAKVGPSIRPASSSGAAAARLAATAKPPTADIDGGCRARRRGARARRAREPRADLVDPPPPRLRRIERDEHVERLHVLDDRRLQLAAERRQRPLRARRRPPLHEQGRADAEHEAGEHRRSGLPARAARSPTTASTSTIAALTSGCTTRSGTFCSSSTSPTNRASRSPRRLEARPSGASGSIRSKTPARIVASWRNDASWPVSRSR